jgi:hypothetical protein
MTSFGIVMAVTAFLSGAAASLFLMVVLGIRKADCPRRSPGTPNAPLDAATRAILRTGTWPHQSVAFSDPGDDQPAPPENRQH